MVDQSKLTDKQRAFCSEYIRDWNATRAAIAAGYSEHSARQIATVTLSKDYVREHINEIQSLHTLTKRKKDEAAREADVGWVYLIQLIGTGYYKIGKTTGRVVDRVRAIETSQPFDVKVVAFAKGKGCGKMERALHKEYQLYRHKREWFVIPPLVLQRVVESIEQWKV